MSNKKRLLTRKVTVITGASQGLGESLARLFASEGASVIYFIQDQKPFSPALRFCQIRDKYKHEE